MKKMKKMVCVLALTAAIGAGSAFAEHPAGLGIGAMWRGLSGPALSLKLPSVPVFWGVSFDFGIYGQEDNTSSRFGVGVQGDYYLVDKTLVPDINLGWYAGFGGYGSFSTWSYKSGETTYSRSYVGLGPRGVIGLDWQPVKWFEVFLDYAPSVGLQILFGHDYSGVGFDSNFLNFEAGVRFWL